MSRCTYGGFTLLEIMLALGLSAILVLGMVRVFLMMQRISCQQQQVFNMLNQVRFITYYLRRQIQQSRWVSVLPHSGSDQLIITKCVCIKKHCQLVKIRYFLRRKSQQLLSDSLYEKMATIKAKELIDHVLQMKIGCEHSAEGIVVKIWLLMRSAQRLFPGKQSYYFDQRTVTRQDGYHYLAWPIAITLRNSLT